MKERISLARVRPGDVAFFSPVGDSIDQEEQAAIAATLRAGLPEGVRIVVSGRPMAFRVLPSWWADAAAIAFVVFVIGVLCAAFR